jgi:hypothetical protein
MVYVYESGFPEKKKKDDPLKGISIAAMIESQKKPEEVFIRTASVTKYEFVVEMTPEEEVRVLEAASKFFSED